jgi:hypothetical protein
MCMRRCKKRCNRSSSFSARLLVALVTAHTSLILTRQLSNCTIATVVMVSIAIIAAAVILVASPATAERVNIEHNVTTIVSCEELKTDAAVDINNIRPSDTTIEDATLAVVCLARTGEASSTHTLEAMASLGLLAGAVNLAMV